MDICSSCQATLPPQASFCPLCDKPVMLERDGRFAEHGCSITVALSQGPPPKRTLRKALPDRKMGPGGGETEPRRMGPHKR